MMQRFGPYVHAFTVGPSYAVAVAPYGNLVAAATKTQIHVWDAASSQVCSSLAIGPMSGIGFSTDAGLLAATSSSLGGLTFDLERQRRIWRSQALTANDNGGPIVSSCGSQLIVTPPQGALLILASDNHKILFHERGLHQHITRIACSPDRSAFAYVDVRD
jgi:hypothetical protein